MFYVVEVKQYKTPMKKDKRKYEVMANCPDDARFFACEKARADGYHVWMDETKVVNYH